MQQGAGFSKMILSGKAVEKLFFLSGALQAQFQIREVHLTYTAEKCGIIYTRPGILTRNCIIKQN